MFPFVYFNPFLNQNIESSNKRMPYFFVFVDIIANLLAKFLGDWLLALTQNSLPLQNIHVGTIISNETIQKDFGKCHFEKQKKGNHWKKRVNLSTYGRPQDYCCEFVVT
jgi:hypothetical protein